MFEIFDNEYNVTGVMEPFHHPGATYGVILPSLL